MSKSHRFNSSLNSSLNGSMIHNSYPAKFQRRMLLRHDSCPKNNSGTSESGLFAEMMNKELIKPYDRSKESDSLYHQRNNSCNLEFKDKWALKTTKICSDPDKIPRIQSFKNYNFPNITNEDKEKYQKNFQDTDNYTIKVPKDKFMNKGENHYLKMKGIISFKLSWI